MSSREKLEREVNNINAELEIYRQKVAYLERVRDALEKQLVPYRLADWRKRTGSTLDIGQKVLVTDEAAPLISYGKDGDVAEITDIYFDGNWQNDVRLKDSGPGEYGLPLALVERMRQAYLRERGEA